MNFAPLTLERYKAVVGEAPKVTMRGFSLVDGEKPLLVVGIFPEEDRHVLFGQVAPEFRSRFDTIEARRWVLLTGKKARELAEQAGGVVHASADPKYPKTDRFLERMGFRHVGRNVYEYRALTMREKVALAEKQMLAHGTPVEIPVRHFFANKGSQHGAYAREITIPKGALVTGKIHLTEQINILSKGDISVLTEDGVKRVQAPFTIVSPAGTKRIAYAHEECVWTTFHATRETEVEKIEAKFIVETEQQFLDRMRQLELKEAA